MVDADRLFFSIKDTWDSVMTLPTDVKELIPEFYSDASFLVNTEELDYGVRSSGALQALSVHSGQLGVCKNRIFTQ